MAATATLNTVRDQFTANIRTEPETVLTSDVSHNEGAEAQSPMAAEEKPQRARMSFLSALLQAFSAVCV
jgi:hypothetical protein